MTTTGQAWRSNQSNAARKWPKVQGVRCHGPEKRHIKAQNVHRYAEKIGGGVGLLAKLNKDNMVPRKQWAATHTGVGKRQVETMKSSDDYFEERRRELGSKQKTLLAMVVPVSSGGSSTPKMSVQDRIKQTNAAQKSTPQTSKTTSGYNRTTTPTKTPVRSGYSPYRSKPPQQKTTPSYGRSYGSGATRNTQTSTTTRARSATMPVNRSGSSNTSGARVLPTGVKSLKERMAAFQKAAAGGNSVKKRQYVFAM